MPSYIVKVNKTEDLYCLWSTVVESPLSWGTEEEVAKDMFQWAMAGDLQARFNRADENGSSTMYGEGWWGDTGWIFEQKGFLRRDRLREFLDSFDEEGQNFDLSLLEPFEDDEV